MLMSQRPFLLASESPIVVDATLCLVCASAGRPEGPSAVAPLPCFLLLSWLWLGLTLELIVVMRTGPGERQLAVMPPCVEVFAIHV